MTRRARATRSLALLGPLLLAPGCGATIAGVLLSQGGSSGGGFAPPESTSVPAITAQAPTGPRTSATFSIPHTLTDAQGDPADLSVTYSAFDLGTGQTSTGTASPAAGGEAMTGLASSPAGTAHAFSWDASRTPWHALTPPAPPCRGRG